MDCGGGPQLFSCDGSCSSWAALMIDGRMQAFAGSKHPIKIKEVGIRSPCRPGLHVQNLFFVFVGPPSNRSLAVQS